MDYKDSINLPKTAFKMKASLPLKEPQRLESWDEMGLYEKIKSSRKDAERFILHDGPPYANGNIHIGHALNKILKDIIIKCKTMEGFGTFYVPGWDCHGLPIEINVEKKLGKKKLSMSKVEIRENCREYAKKFVDIQKEEFKRLGVLGEWDNPYLTTNPVYTATIVREFGKFADSGNLFKQKKPIQWCSSCRTALAEAEVEYMDHKSPSVYVKFEMVSDIGLKIPALQGKKVSMLIWTTTPWTLPANLAICLHSDFEYVAVKAGDDILILAEGLLTQTMLTCGIQGFEILESFKGSDLENMKCRHPLYDRESLVILGHHVTLEAGTGCVHTAPGHGLEDYIAGMKYGLDIYTPVDDFGKFTDDVEFFAGQFVFDANKDINEALLEKGALLKEEQIVHSYPHCWRCKKPVIFRATEQWFISMEKNDLQKKALEIVDEVEWIPHWGKERIQGMIGNRPDWCISRQRSWGVPIVAFYCRDCGEVLLSSEIINYVADLFEKESSDIWFSREALELLPEGTKCASCGKNDFEKETDILDVWFDSGVSHAAVLEKREGLISPCDLYLEGSDQHRGWFQSSLLTSVGTRSRAPFKSVLTHGFVVDGKGRKMAKSEGNVIAPEKIIKQYGAEIIRLWVASENYHDDMRISQDILQRMSEAYRKIRNTCRFVLGNISDFDPGKDMVPLEDLQEIDKWALHRLNILTEKVRGAYDKYEFHTVYHSITNFCITDMSAVYLDILKDRLYCSSPDESLRRTAQTSLYIILRDIVKLLAPVLSFTAEEVWSFVPGEKEESVHLALFPTINKEFENKEVAGRWDVVLKVRDSVLKILEEARVDKVIGNSLEASVKLEAPQKLYDFLSEYKERLADIFIVSHVELTLNETMADVSLEESADNISVSVLRADGEKCERCWKYFTVTQGSNQSVCGRCGEALESYDAAE